jgi:hypothetical protein
MTEHPLAVSLRKDSPNETTVQIGDLTLAFSYETVVGFATPSTGWVVSENVWSRTTGKHLNRLPRGTIRERISHDEFLGLLNHAVTQRGLAVWPS